MFKINIEQDFKDFFGVEREEFLSKFDLNDVNKIKRFAFNQIKPHDKESAKLVYHSPWLNAFNLSKIGVDFFEKSQVNPQLHKNPVIQIPLREFKDKNISILDFGCGLANYSIALYSLGYKDISLADIPTMTFKFLRFLCTRYKISVKFLEIKNENWLKDNKFHYIINSEVMEHLWNPVEEMRELLAHLYPGGWMYLSTFFNDLGGEDPTHLSHNNKFQDSELWYKELEKIGLYRKIRDENGVWKGFRKID